MERKGNPKKRIRKILVIVTVTTTAILGMITPSTTPSLLSSTLVAGFAISFSLTLATLVAMMPSVADPRQRSNNDEVSKEDSPEDDTSSVYPSSNIPTRTST